jgi:hypothetical protein
VPAWEYEIRDVKAIFPGYGYAVLVMADDSLRLWETTALQTPRWWVGDQLTANAGKTMFEDGSFTPEKIARDLPKGYVVKEVSSCLYSMAVILDDGTVRVWGEKSFDDVEALAGTDANPIKSIVLGHEFLVCLYDDGTVAVRGEGATVPEDVANAKVADIACNINSCMALLESGAIRCWEVNSGQYSEYGIPPRFTDDPYPRKLVDWMIWGMICHFPYDLGREVAMRRYYLRAYFRGERVEGCLGGRYSMCGGTCERCGPTTRFAATLELLATVVVGFLVLPYVCYVGRR